MDMKNIWKLMAIVAIFTGLAACKKDPVAVQSISLDKNEIELEEGSSTVLVATVLPDNAVDKTVVWSSDDPSIATVSDGTVTAVKVGETKIKATSGGFTAECAVSVLYPAVDLGLSVKWAAYNVGAEKPEDKGSYFAWGETSPKNNYAWTNEGDYLWGVYQYGKPLSGMTKYTADKEGGDGLKTLLPDDDAATKNWGEKWRTPTLDEINELIDETKCKWTWDDQKVGYTVTSQINGKSIFLPAAGIRVNTDVAGENQGCYMSSSVRWSETSNAVYAHNLYFNSYRHEASYHNRCIGHSVRAVTEY